VKNLKSDRIPIYGPLIEDDDIAATEEALRRGWLGMGKDVSAFEAAVGAAVGVPGSRVVAVSTGFAALHVALLVADIGPGDEVVVPSVAHLSDVQAILAVGAEPVFCDSYDETMCIDVARVEELLGPRTKAIVALDYGPFLYEHDAIDALARANGLRVVHDAAHSFGSAVDGRPVGSYSDLCMFSFDPVKSLTAIDAGLLVCGTEDEARKAREVRLLGSDQPPAVMYQNARTWDYDAVRIGYRYHLSNIHAAMGCSQVAKLGRIKANRSAACQRYAENLKGVDAVYAPYDDFSELCPFMYFIRVPDDRDGMRASLGEQGIDTGLHWRPAHQHTFFKDFRRGPLPVSEAAGHQLVSLPLHSDMPLDIVDRVTDAIIEYFN
jgi:dTDP-4-amino-4,6-dideoxygalactose transaminase